MWGLYTGAWCPEENRPAAGGHVSGRYVLRTVEGCTLMYTDASHPEKIDLRSVAWRPEEKTACGRSGLYTGASCRVEPVCGRWFSIHESMSHVEHVVNVSVSLMGRDVPRPKSFLEFLFLRLNGSFPVFWGQFFNITLVILEISMACDLSL